MKLVNINIDQISLEQNLQNALSGLGTFAAAFPGETGTVLVQIATSLATLLLYRIDSATQNNFIASAFSQASAYAAASSMGVNPRGRSPATVTLTLTLPTTGTLAATLPSGTIFNGRGTTWYTAQAYTIVPGQPSLTVQVFQGTQQSAAFSGTGMNYQRYVVGNNYEISDGSITIYIDNVLWTLEPTSSLILAGNSNSYITKVGPTGQLIVLFGDGISGRVPDSGSNILITWTENDGSQYNSSVINDAFINTENLPIIATKIVSSSATSQGDDEEDLDYLKVTTPRLFAAQQQAARRQDHIGWLLKYPGIISARVWGEYEEALDRGYADNSMMNRAYFSVLLDDIVVSSGNNIGTAISGTPGYSLSLGQGISIIPGSLNISINNDTYYDNSDIGYLFSDNSTPNVALGGTASASATLSTSNVYFAWNNTDVNVYYSSGVRPTALNPVSLYYTLPTIEVFAAIRMQAVASDFPDTRAFPSQIQMYGTNDPLPYSLSTNWTNLGYYMNFPDPGRETYTQWQGIANASPYNGIRIDILNVYGNSNNCNIANIQLAQFMDLSTINYSTNTINLNVPSSYSGNIIAEYAIPNLGPADIADITSYIASKTMFTTQITFRNPIMCAITVELNVFLTASANPTQVTASIQTALQNLFSLTIISLGNPIFISDIYRTVLQVDGVDYATVISPAYDIIPFRNQFQFLENVIISSNLSVRSIGS